MMNLNRRRFISISAAAVAAPNVVMASPITSWNGIALGAKAQIHIVGRDVKLANQLITRTEAEIDRLESIFSLYRTNSLLNRLNANGYLASPPPEFLEVLSLSTIVHKATGGAFDPSIQPLWAAYAMHRSPEEISAARALVDWNNLNFKSNRVSFAKRGMALSFNGIAQGYIADRVASLLRGAGLSNVLVNTGEIQAIGHGQSGAGWHVGIVEPHQSRPVHNIFLGERSLATSALMGTKIGDTGRAHLIDPRTGTPGGKWSVMSVSAKMASLADALSTAFCLLDEEEISMALQVFTDARIEYQSKV